MNTPSTLSPSHSAALPSALVGRPSAAGAAGLPRTNPRRGVAGADDLSTGQQRAVVGAILLLHIGLGYGLLQVQAVRDAVSEAAPILVDLLTPPAPPPPTPPVPVPPPPQRAMPKKPPPPAPVISAAPSPAPAAFTAPPPPAVIEPLATVAPPTPPVDVAVQAPAAPPPPAPPKMIPASAVQYLEQVVPTYPPVSVRLHETGRPVVRVLIDEGGLPRTVQIYQPSSSGRLDEACVAALKKSRFKPYTENGQPTAGWAIAPCHFEM